MGVVNSKESKERSVVMLLMTLKGAFQGRVLLVYLVFKESQRHSK